MSMYLVLTFCLLFHSDTAVKCIQGKSFKFSFEVSLFLFVLSLCVF